MSNIVMSGDMGPAKRPGQQRGAQVSPQQRQQAMKAAAGNILQTLQKAWNSQNATAFASAFAEKADFVPMAGGHLAGRDKIEAAHKALFAQKTQAAYRVVKMKPLGPDVFMAFLGQQIKAADSKGGGMRTRPTAIIRRVGQEWKIVAMQVTRVAAGGGRAAAVEGGAAKAAKAPAAKAESKAPAKGAKGK